MKLNRLLMTTAISVAAALAAGSAQATDLTGKLRGARNHGGDEVGIQMFHWNTSRNKRNSWYSEMNNASNVALMKDLGVTMAWMPPPWSDTSYWGNGSGNDGTGGGGEGYFWKNFDLNSYYGSASSLSTLANTYATGASNSPDGIKMIYDMVLNHRDYGRQSSNVWNYASDGRWNKNAWSSGDSFVSGDAEVNVGNASTDYKNAMNDLVYNYKAAGFRYDFVRGFDPGLINSIQGGTSDNGFCIGELWKDPNTNDQLAGWATAAGCTAFDFSAVRLTRGGTTSISAVRYGLHADPDPYRRAQAVLAFDNHDISWSPGGGQHLWTMNDSLREPLTAYMGVAPGTPMFYFPYLIDDTSSTWTTKTQYGLAKAAIALRKDAGVLADSAITFYNSEGLQFMVQGTKKKIIGLLWTSVTTPNAMNSSFDNAKYNCTTATGGLDGSWGKICIEKPTTYVSPDGYTAANSKMCIRGTNNNWDASAPMVLTANNVWTGKATFGATSAEAFKFEASCSATWGSNWGGTSAGSGTATLSSTSNIPVTGGAGIYTVTFNDSSLAYTVTKDTTAPAGNTAPTAKITYGGAVVSSAMSSVTSTAVALSGASSVEPDAGQSLSYSWACVNTATNGACGSWFANSAAAALSVTPTAVGSYKLTLTVTDNYSTPASSSANVTLNVAAAGITSKFASAYISGTNNAWGFTAMQLSTTTNYLWEATVAFTGASTDRFKINRYNNWTAAYGCTGCGLSGTASSTGGDIYIPTSQGAGNFKITFNDNTLAYTVTKVVTVTVPPEVTAISTSGTLTEGQSITLSATISNSPTSYKWVYGTTTIGSSASQAWTLPGAGDLTVSLAATNSGGTGTLSKVITVANVAPVANAGADQAKKTTQAITLDGSASADNGSTSGIATYQWSEGGTNIGIGKTLTLDARAAGTYTFQLDVTDGEGGSASDTVVVTVTTNAVPTANAGADVSKTQAESITGTGTDTDGTIASYLWKEGTTTVCTTATCSMAGLSVGTHTLTLTVTDNDGATSSGDDVVVTVTSATASVTFTCTNVPTVNTGEAVFISGDNAVLGSWAVPTSTAAGQKLATINGSSRSGTITGLPVSAARSFKCVIAPSGGGTIRLWGTGANQSVTTGAAGSTVTKSNNFNN